MNTRRMPTSDNLKGLAWDDERFAAYVAEVGPLNTLLDLMEFKWILTDQIRDREEYGGMNEDWSRRVISVIVRVKSRIAELRRTLRAAGRTDEMNAAVWSLRDERDDEAVAES